MTLLYENLTYILRGMFFKVYNELGPGFKEDVYKQALITLLHANNIAHEKEKHFQIHFKDAEIGATRLDLVVDNKIIIEVKVTEVNNHLFEKQILSYLKNTGLSLGFLVNFGMDKLFIKRFINTKVSVKSINRSLKSYDEKIRVIKDINVL